jgi:hypothetical protein
MEEGETGKDKKECKLIIERKPKKLTKEEIS